MAAATLDPRILIMGLSDPSMPEGGAGPYLARSLRPAFRDVEVLEGSAETPDFSRILRDYELVILLDTMSMGGGPGEIQIVSPYVLTRLKARWDETARSLDRAIHDAHLLGHKVPPVYVVAMCMPDPNDVPPATLRGLAVLYREVVPRARQMVRELIESARAPPGRARDVGA